MRVLLTGASGLLGRALLRALVAHGHDVVAGARDIARVDTRSPRVRAIAIDFACDVSVDDWLPRLSGIDAVVNAAGIFRESGAATFERVHTSAPVAMFRACVVADVRRVVQLSALGADEDAVSAFHRSKKRADDVLLSLPLSALVLQPSLVFATNGDSARFFLSLAVLPVVALPRGGGQCIQPVHRRDVVHAVVRALGPAMTTTGRVALVGPHETTVRDYLAALRRQLGRAGKQGVVAVPAALARAGARVLAMLPRRVVDPDALAMLERGNCADSRAAASLLGRAPRAYARFIDAAFARRWRARRARASAFALLRATLAFLWVFTGIVSIAVYPRDESLALLRIAGVPDSLGDFALYGAGALDIVLGIALYVPRAWRAACVAQLLLVAFYTLVISVTLPAFWWHPYGPISKNLPLMAATWLLYRRGGK